MSPTENSQDWISQGTGFAHKVSLLYRFPSEWFTTL